MDGKRVEGRPKYEHDKGEGLYRRSLYTYWKRSVAPPAMMVFDASDKNYCTVRRQSTATPLQALALLNDEMYIETARLLAERMMREGGNTPGDRLAYAFRLATSRNASAAEVAVLQAGFEKRLAQYRAEGFTFVTLQEAMRDPFYKEDADLGSPPATDNLATAMAQHGKLVPPQKTDLSWLNALCR